MKKTLLAVFGCLMLLSFVVNCFQECSNESDVWKFKRQMKKGNLTEAESVVADMGDNSTREGCALRLIQEYIGANATQKAIHVYEDLTPRHSSRASLDGYGSYEDKACKLLRKQLIKDGDYEKAWDYYPLSSNNENYTDNASDHFSYMSDVVAAMCAEGQQEDARKFVDSHVRWFVNNVDMSTSDLYEKTRATYDSQTVSAKLQEQIDNSY